MKKAISALLATAMLFATSAPTAAHEPYEPNPRLYATIDDALAILRRVVDLPTEIAVSVDKHDFDGDGVIGVADALLVLRGIVGLGERQMLGIVDGGERLMARLPEELELQIRQDWLETLNALYSEGVTDVAEIFRYWGTYDFGVVVAMYSTGLHGSTSREIGGKIFGFSFEANQSPLRGVPLHRRGGSRSSRSAGRDAVDANGAIDEWC